MARRAWAAALTVAGFAFMLYHATLLPGLDFGDTGSFQTIVGSPAITPRDGYPLYFALGNLFLCLTQIEPAHALNLVSAVEGAIACGLLVLVGSELAGSSAAGVAATLLFAGSYTFWSQAIIAEVYALHALFVGLTLFLLLRWAERPTIGRLALFFGAYALGFGNHLSMGLLAPGYMLFLLVTAPRGWRSMFAPRIVALATTLAAAGALQYAWNLSALWLWPNEAHGLIDALRIFWFDVTKSNWRDTMVMRIPQSMLGDRLAMYWFDVRQQFGAAVLLAPIGLLRLLATRWRRGVLMLALYGVNVAFAFSYNVGDTHVFYLPSHLILAMLAAPGIVFAGEAAARVVITSHRCRQLAVTATAAAVAASAGLRIYWDYPALDRSGDRRPAEVLSRLTEGLDGRETILLANLDWEIQNGLSYFSKETRPEVAWTRMSDVILYAPALVGDNFAIGRDVALTAGARDELASAYGPLLPATPDPRVHVATIAELAQELPARTRYVLCVLRPTRQFTLDFEDLRIAVHALTGGAMNSAPDGDYAAIAGLAGEPPALAAGGNLPFRARATLGGVAVDVRMESWLAFDTFRRMGFGQVIAARHHALIVERGVSFVAFDEGGRPLRTGYGADIFAPQPRYLIRRPLAFDPSP